VMVDEGVEYRFKYYARGRGDIRVGLFDNDLGNGDFGYKYSSYFTLNSADWIEINQSVVADTTYPLAQFLFSVRNTILADGHIQIDSVSITSATVEFTRIYDIQFTTSPTGDSEYIDQTVITGGIVTGVKANPNGGYFLQAGTGAWSGIFVFDPTNNATVAIGDSLILDGVVEERFGNTQLKNVSNIEKVSSSNPSPTPFVAPTGTLASEPYEGVLVRAQDATCTSAPNNFNEWSINDGSGVILVDDDLFNYSPVLVNSRYNVTGPITFGFSQFRILPRSAADVSIVLGLNNLNEVTFEVYPNPATSILNIQLNNNTENTLVELRNINGQLVESKRFNNAQLFQINTADYAKGIYLLTVTNNNERVSRLVSIQ